MTQVNHIVGSGWRFPPSVDGRGGIALAQGQDDIEQAIGIILSTPRGFRVMRPNFGCRIHELLFAPINASTITTAVHYVKEALGWWEPRIAVGEVYVDPDPDQPTCLLITVLYEIRATHDERALIYPFYTIPDED
ncbi:MAG TPA: GPW/gp25 family protein [Roseiflexaceae bacterium]|nr:GPW/gp25 family protein [Roseiflexaceae bacterium]